MKIRLLRQMQGLSQEYMAQKMGVSQPAYSKLEFGKTKITLPKRALLAEVLQCDLADLEQKSVDQLVRECLDNPGRLPKKKT